MADDSFDRQGQQEQLEAALPRVLDRLEQLRGELPEHERTVLDEIIVSAAVHADQVAADDISDPRQRMFMKPMSVHMTLAMREQILEAPRRFGIAEQE
ncbi:MAG TPA: hypothetical protein VJ851_04210 [Jatrophihabitans sp.]|nr:hypothetical protein [Jatrophihabitans sp.]